MLSNKDFSSLLKTGGLSAQGGNSEGGGGKVRYDLKQVASWDKQIQSENKKKEGKQQKGSKSSGKNSNDATVSLPPGYRDRVAERRANQNIETSLARETEELLSNVSPKRTKHSEGETDLPKGLDFALLEKIREQTKQELMKLEKKIYQQDSDSDNDDSDDYDDTGNHHDGEGDDDDLTEKDLADIKPKSKLGLQLKGFLLKQRESTNKENNKTNHFNEPLSTQSLLENIDKTGKAYILDPTKALQQQHQQRSQQRAQKTAEQSVLSRSVHEFNINPNSLQDLPLTIVKSRKESKFSEEMMSCLLDGELFTNLLSIFEDGKIVPRTKRQTKVSFAPSSSSFSSIVPKAPAVPVSVAPSAPSVKGFDSIYDDIDDKYDPLASVSAPPAVEEKKRKPKKRKAENVAVVFTDDEEEGSDVDQAMAVVDTHQPSASLKGLFNNVRQTAVVLPRSTPTTSHPSTVSKPEVSKAPAITAKDKATKNREDIFAKYGSTSSNGVSYVSDKGNDGKQVIHRDVFASTIDNVVYTDASFGKKEGDAFGLKGDYDTFLETTGDYEVCLL